MKKVSKYLTGNYTPGRRVTVNQLVMHTIEGSVPSADQTFRNPERKASTHDGIREGEVWLWVHEQDVAWGAGSHAVNEASHNVETEGYARDMNRSALLLNTIAERMGEVLKDSRYDIPNVWTVGKRPGVKGHGDITPDRRWDPGAMDVGFLTWSLARQGVLMDWDTFVKLSATTPYSWRESWLVHYVQRVVGATVDGLFGPGTGSAVKQYQTRLGIGADGVWGYATWTAHMRTVRSALDKRYPITPAPPPPVSDVASRLVVLERQVSAAHDKIRNLEANKAGVGHGPTHKIS